MLDYGASFEPSPEKPTFSHFHTDPEMYALRNMLSAQVPCNNNTTTMVSCPVPSNYLPVKRPSVNNRMAYVEALVDTNALLIESIWCSSPTTKTAAVVPLRTFIQEVLKRSRATYSTLQTSLFYLFRSRPAITESLQRRLHGNSKGCTRSCHHSTRCESAYIRCGRRMFLASLVVASKFVQDKTYRNSAWAKIAGLPVAEINAAERIFLELIDYRLYIAQPTFEQWHHMLHMHVAAKTQNQPTTLHDLSYRRWNVLTAPSPPLSYSPHSIESVGGSVYSPHTNTNTTTNNITNTTTNNITNNITNNTLPPVLSLSLPSSINSSPAQTPSQISPIRVNTSGHPFAWKTTHSPFQPISTYPHDTHYRLFTPPSLSTKRECPEEEALTRYGVSHVRESKRKQIRVQ
ncbi:hypothetical protein BDF14DRAFT_1736569 [Spinellus fusiger]|nr:hypothetical protein BDF14DRAFT_1736569 [Spinellus fusiger]